MFASKDIFLKSSGGGYQISRSVRLRSSASAYLNRTPASASNRTTWTWSGWVKRGSLGSVQELFMAGAAGTDYTALFFNSTDTLCFHNVASSANAGRKFSSAVYRDPSAWYHIVAVWDTTNATAGSRMLLYVNGVQLTAFSPDENPSSSQVGQVNNNAIHTISKNSTAASQYVDGYLTEINFIDGQALTPSSFGETNAITGVWQPKKYGGTYGTNGFYLNFSDNSAATAAAIGKDSSGNGNNWTPNNISVTAGVTYDSMLDVPTLYADGGNGRGNYAVWNPLSVVSPTTLADGNLGVVTGTTGGGGAFSTITIPTSGKYYFEFIATAVSATLSDNARIGLATASVGNYVLYKSDGNKVVDGTTSAYGSSFALNDVIGCAIDVDGGTVTFYKNNVTQGSITYSTSNGNYFAYTQDGSGTVSVTANINFGQRPFTYTPPTGFKALNTQNLPTPTISNGATVMAATLYTGNGTTTNLVNSVNGVSFKPDLVWQKNISSAANNILVDSVRGGSLYLISNTTGADASAPGYMTFNSNGESFTSSDIATNQSGQSYVAWQWNAGGTSTNITVGQYGTSPNVPSIASTVRANPTAGFSVVTYTGNGTQPSTVGHGLGVAPSMVILKTRNSALYDWNSYHISLGNTQYIALNTTAAASSAVSLWNNTTPTSTVFTVNHVAVNTSSNTYVAYCFAAVAGYSAFGKYTGNGSADGPFVYLGFRPRFVMLKRTDVANDWAILDTARNTFNVTTKVLFPNSSVAEGTQTTPMDILSNGFKVRNGADNYINANGGTYIYACFAENPFKNSLAR